MSPSRHQIVTALLAGWTALVPGLAPRLNAASRPIALHPQNPHYFLWRGKPTILLTSGEHYGAVLNLDFEFHRYLDTLARDRLNLTRLFTGGGYVEPVGAFKIDRNTLAPATGRFICPWARSSEPGYANGGNKFDLSRWDPAYFRRLHDFVRHASRRGVVVEVNLFCPQYEDAQWRLSPFNSANNVNGVGSIARTNVCTLDRHGGLLEVQERMVRKFVDELRDYDNVYYEICNEPYFGGVTLEWQHHIAKVIQESQRNHAHRKLISRNVANGKALVADNWPEVSIYNFHYAAPPDTVTMNWGLKKVIGDNETGFRGTNDAPYRLEGWEFLFAGGGLYNNLDYSFVAGKEDGTHITTKETPGGGNPAFRRQMSVLGEFIRSFDFIRMSPDNTVIVGGIPPGARAFALVEAGRQYAIHVGPVNPTKPHTRMGSLSVNLPKGTYRAEWIDPASGATLRRESFTAVGGSHSLPAPEFSEAVALRIRRL
jgi:hypothetical protein